MQCTFMPHFSSTLVWCICASAPTITSRPLNQCWGSSLLSLDNSQSLHPLCLLNHGQVSTKTKTCTCRNRDFSYVGTHKIYKTHNYWLVKCDREIIAFMNHWSIENKTFWWNTRLLFKYIRQKILQNQMDKEIEKMKALICCIHLHREKDIFKQVLALQCLQHNQYVPSDDHRSRRKGTSGQGIRYWPMTTDTDHHTASNTHILGGVGWHCMAEIGLNIYCNIRSYFSLDKSVDLCILPALTSQLKLCLWKI